MHTRKLWREGAQFPDAEHISQSALLRTNYGVPSFSFFFSRPEFISKCISRHLSWIVLTLKKLKQLRESLAHRAVSRVHASVTSFLKVRTKLSVFLGRCSTRAHFLTSPENYVSISHVAALTACQCIASAKLLLLCLAVNLRSKTAKRSLPCRHVVDASDETTPLGN